MADPWPAELPQCFNVPFSSGMGDGRIAYQPDKGPAIMRRRTSSTVKTVSGQMRMTRDQVGALQDFIETTLLGGSLPFTFKDPTSQETVLVRLPDGSLPDWRQISGGSFLVSMQLEVLP